MLTRITKTGNRHRDRTVSNHPHVVSRPGTQPVSREESEGLRERQSLLWWQENGRTEPAQVAPRYLVNQPPTRGARGFRADGPCWPFQMEGLGKRTGLSQSWRLRGGERGAAGFLPSRPTASAGLWLSRAGPGPSSPQLPGV